MVGGTSLDSRRMSKPPVRAIRGGGSIPARAENRLRQLARAAKRKYALHDFLRAVGGPAPAPEAASPRVAILLCAGDYYMATAAMKAYVLANGHPIRFQIHEDGSLESAQVEALRAEFPGCPVVTRAEADARAAEALASYPRLQTWRGDFNIALKATDVPLFWEGDTHVRLIDSDVLAHRPCEALFAPRAPTESVFNFDTETAYVATLAKLRAAYGVALPANVNSGAFVMPRAAFDHAYMERVLSAEAWGRWAHQRWHFQEQTVLTMCAAAYGPVGYLPPDYDVSYERSFADSTQKHYIRNIRHGFELEGLDYLLKHADVAGRWTALLSAAS